MTSRSAPWRRLARAGLAAVVAAMVLSGCSVYDIPLPGGADVGSNPTTLHIKFHDVLDLVPQSTVKVDDVTVGRVSDIKLDGYVADVTIKVPSDMKIPTNERVKIDQTSLLGEKFINLKRPARPSGRFLADGDTIPLKHTGRNPEVEEVLGALSALLNGGGVAQIKTIAHELNTAVGGREDDVREVLDQIHTFMGVLDANKEKVVGAIDGLNHLAASIRKQDGTIKQTLADMPSALKSVNSQRADLRKLLGALSRLSNVGVKVIKASKEATINSLSDLAPVLTAFAKSGQALPKSLQVILTYPFIDAAVGNSPTVARNLHMGDYTNLNASLDLDLKMLAQGLGLPTDAPLQQLVDICKGGSPDSGQALCDALEKVVGSVCGLLGNAGAALCEISGAVGNTASSKTRVTPDSTGTGPTGGSGDDTTTSEKSPVDQAADALGNLLGGNDTSATSNKGSSTDPSGGSGTLGGLLGGLGLGRPAPSLGGRIDPADLEKPEVKESLRRLENLAGVGKLLWQGVYS